MSNICNKQEQHEALLISIARCNDTSLAMSNRTHPCNQIVNSQLSNVFQLPEPWNGDIKKAQILFIASNPSYNPREEGFPTEQSSDEDIRNFFIERFNNAYYKKLRYWGLITKYASWILDCPKEDETLWEKICITEIVHCKSTRETGVARCGAYCAEKWLNRILDEYTGEKVVLLGKRAKEYCVAIRNHNKKVFWMPHPNARGVSDRARKQLLEEQMS